MTPISVVGLGKLGLCLAACYAERGFKVIGVDINNEVIDKVNSGKAPWFEPRLAELLAKHGGSNLQATNQHYRAINETDITIILTATPSNPDGSFSNCYIEDALKSLAESFKDKKTYHLFVISSTVMPGSIGGFINILEKHSGRTYNEHFGVAYDPDFVALGNVIKGFLEPDLVVIGQSRPEVGDRIEALHHELCINKPAIHRMSLISAEMAKVCLNAYITMKISFANTIGNLCEKIPHTDPDAITKAIGSDRRISPYYLQGGLSYGGTCFPRDVKAFTSMTQKYEVDTGAVLMKTVNAINRYQDKRLAEIVEGLAGKKSTVGILGLAFTDNTPVIVESPAIKLIKTLIDNEISVIVYDPLAMDNTRALFENSVIYARSMQECLAADICVLTLRSQKYKEAVETYIPKKLLTVVDCWRILNPIVLDNNIRLIRLWTSCSK